MLSNAGCVPLARASAKGNLLSQADPAGLQAAMTALDVKLNLAVRHLAAEAGCPSPTTAPQRPAVAAKN